MDVVFYIEIWFSYGEREHALSFARQIQEAGYRPRFVVDPRIARHIELAGFEPASFSTPQEGVEIVRRIDPAMIIGCEFYNLSDASARGLIATGKPIATMDGTSIGRDINTDPFRTVELSRTLVLPERFHAFRPSPVNDLGPDSEDVFHFSLFSRAERIAKDERIYRDLKLDPARRTVLLPIASWAEDAVKLLGLKTYYRDLMNPVIAGLEAVGGGVDLVMVSRDASQTVRRGTVDVHFPGLLTTDRFDHLLTSCEAIVSDNIIQTSLSKAFVMGTPHLVIQNTAEPSRPREPWLPTLPFACNIFPVKQLFPLEREYSRAVEVAEFSDPRDVRDKVVAILRDGHCDPERKDARDRYVEGLAGLRRPGDILQGILGPAMPER